MPRVLLLPLLAIVLTATGCASDKRPATDLAGPRPHAQQQRSTTPDASPRPHRTQTPSPGPGGPRKTGKTAPLLPLQRDAVGTHLLDAGRLPVLTDGLTWAVVDEGPEGTQSVGACQKTALESIGALNAVRRTYAGSVDDADHGSATQVVARFADDKSAWRAHEVLRSWREDCEARLAYPRKEVGPLETVAVRVGTGDSYRAVYGPRSEKRGSSTGLGIVRTGSFLSIVEITTGAGDYPSSWDPARVAVRRIARTFS